MAKASENQYPKVTFAESAAPSTPAAGLANIYVKTDGKLYLKDDAGTETDLTATAAGGGITDPTDITGCILWLDADAIAGLSDTDPVTTWTDGSSGSNNFTGSGSTRPLYRTNIQNSKPAVRFDGTDDVLTAGSALIPADGDFTLIIACSITSEATYGSLISQYAAGQTGRMIMVSNQNDGGTDTAGRFNPSINGVTDGSGGGGAFDDHPYPDPCIITLTGTNGGPAAFRINGIHCETATIVSVYTGVVTGLGRDAAGVLNAFDGDVFEVALYDPHINMYDIHQVEDYLADKWAI